jgi:hypothetical protein
VAHMKAQMRRIDELGLDLTGVDFLNLDLQGAEAMAIRGMGDLIKGFKWVYSEVNKEELYEGCMLIDSFDLLMLSHGFRRIETKWCGNTGWGDSLYSKA